MSITITINSEHLQNLDLSPIEKIIEKSLEEQNISNQEQQINFEINYPRESGDPRELSEISEVRLWFIRLDSRYPWLPFLLDWKSGELSRYTAMLVPHQFSKKDGIQYNPEGLEIFIMSKIFVLGEFLRKMGIPSQSRLKSMSKMFGYDIDDQFFAFLEK